MPAENRKRVNELLAKAALVFGVASTDKKIGVPFEVDDDGFVKVVFKAIGATAVHIINGCLEVVRGRGGLTVSGILTADTQLKPTPGDIYWISICGDDVLYVEINDSVGDAPLRDRWGQFYPADNYSHYIFDPPIECDTAIYIDITTNGNAQVVVGYK